MIVEYESDSTLRTILTFKVSSILFSNQLWGHETHTRIDAVCCFHIMCAFMLNHYWIGSSEVLVLELKLH